MLMKAGIRKDDRNLVVLGDPGEPPAGARLWVRAAGHLIGGKASFYVSDPAPRLVIPHVVLEGRGRVRTAFGETPVGRGDMFSLVPGTEVTYFQEPSAPWVFHWAQVNGEDAERLFDACGFDRQRPWLRPADPKRVIATFRAIREFLAERPTRRPYRVVALLYELMDACRGEVSAPRAVSGEARLVRDALALIEAQLASLDVNRLAEGLRVDRTTLFKAFKVARGESPLRVLQAARIDRAQSMLAQGHHKFAVIARAVGFANDKSFSRAFRQHVGMSPKEWQGRHAGS
jgi:AraC-like DNA-binding protein